MVVCQSDCKHLRRLHKNGVLVYVCREYKEEIDDMDLTYRCPRHTPKKRTQEYENVATILIDPKGVEIVAYPAKDRIRRYVYKGVEYFHCENLYCGKYWFCFKPSPAIAGNKRHMESIIDNILYSQGASNGQ